MLLYVYWPAWHDCPWSVKKMFGVAVTKPCSICKALLSARLFVCFITAELAPLLVTNSGSDFQSVIVAPLAAAT